MIQSMQPCPLCKHSATHLYHHDRHRQYFHCPGCMLVFADRGSWLPAAAEKAEYDLHQNDPGDPGYRRFLSRLADPLIDRLPAGASGLDFGCGPGPALAAMLTEQGFDMKVYDKFYAADDSVWQSAPFDFITATEVIEHLQHPYEVLNKLRSHLRPGGLLAVMTKLVISRQRFGSWHYIRDPTHICFFSRPVFEWLAAEQGWTTDYPAADVIFLTKSM